MQLIILQQWLPVLLPVAYSLIGTSVGKVLAQDGFSREMNGAIAWLVVVLCAIGTAYLSHQIIGDPYAIGSTIIGIITLLISGGLSSIKPYLIYLDFLQTHVFNIVPKSPVNQAVPVAKQPTVMLPSLPTATGGAGTETLGNQGKGST